MKLFGKQPKAQESPHERRRPSSSDKATNRAQAFSYYAQRSNTTNNTGRGQREDISDAARTASTRTPGLSRPLIMALGGVLIVLLLYALMLSNNPKVVPLTADGRGYFIQDTDMYAESVARVLGSSLLNKNKLTVDTQNVSSELTKNYPEIKSVRVALPIFGHQPTVYIEPYRPALILTTPASAAYLIDENGRALVSTSQITDKGDLTVPTVHDKGGLSIELGKRALAGATVRFIEETLSLLEAAKVRHGTVTLPETASELHVAIHGTPYFVKFNLQGNVREQVGTYLATKERLKRENTISAEYIDVRVPERSYYR